MASTSTDVSFDMEDFLRDLHGKKEFAELESFLDAGPFPASAILEQYPEMFEALAEYATNGIRNIEFKPGADAWLAWSRGTLLESLREALFATRTPRVFLLADVAADPMWMDTATRNAWLDVSNALEQPLFVHRMLNLTLADAVAREGKTTYLIDRDAVAARAYQPLAQRFVVEWPADADTTPLAVAMATGDHVFFAAVLRVPELLIDRIHLLRTSTADYLAIAASLEASDSTDVMWHMLAVLARDAPRAVTARLELGAVMDFIRARTVFDVKDADIQTAPEAPEALRPALRAMQDMPNLNRGDWGEILATLRHIRGDEDVAELRANDTLRAFYNVKMRERVARVGPWRVAWVRTIGWELGDWIERHARAAHDPDVLVRQQRLTAFHAAHKSWRLFERLGGRDVMVESSDTSVYASSAKIPTEDEAFNVEPKLLRIEGLSLTLEARHTLVVPDEYMYAVEGGDGGEDGRALEHPLVWFPTSQCLILEHIEFEAALQGLGLAQHVFRLLEQGITRAGAPLDHLLVHFVHRPTYHVVDKRHGWRDVNTGRDMDAPLEKNFPGFIRGGALNTEWTDSGRPMWHLCWSTPAARMLTRLLTNYAGAYFETPGRGLHQNVLLRQTPPMWPLVQSLVEGISAFVSNGAAGQQQNFPPKQPYWRGSYVTVALRAAPHMRADVVPHLRALGNRDAGGPLEVELTLATWDAEVDAELKVREWLPWLLVMLCRVWCRPLWLIDNGRPPRDGIYVMNLAMRPWGTRTPALILTSDNDRRDKPYKYYWVPRAKPVEYDKDTGNDGPRVADPDGETLEPRKNAPSPDAGLFETDATAVVSDMK